MTNKVVNFPGVVRPETTEQDEVTGAAYVPKVLEQAGAENLTMALVLGWDAEGAFYYNSSNGDGREMLMLLEMGKVELMAAIMNGAE